MAIKDWPVEDRPREKLMLRGAEALSDSELVAIFLRTGSAGRSAVELARDLLARAGGVRGLSALAARDLQHLPGIGVAKYAQLQAALELARRALAQEVERKDAMRSPAQVRDYLRLCLEHEDRECFLVLFLDAQNRVVAREVLFKGTLTETSVYPREVVRRALAHNAAAVILSHNHPSGVAEPSRADELLTRTLQSALALVEVKVLDHVIVGRGSAISFAERGLL